MESPFQRHRGLVLGHYATAAWLRSVVMAMWNGHDYKVGLGQLGSLDARHFDACMDLFAHYRKHGENDPAFLRLADEVRRRMEQEAAAERDQALERRSAHCST
jgi:hypothetical protein